MNRMILMGVAGSGKSTVGSQLAAMLGVPFADGDDFHARSAIRKMAAGVPLGDSDREPWLKALGEWLSSQPSGAVVACSALRRRYRDLLRATAGELLFLHLVVEPATVEQRVRLRADHFMPAALIKSQFADLDELELDEDGLELDGTRPPQEICSSVVNHIRARKTCSRTSS
jgi:gluconokinase